MKLTKPCMNLIKNETLTIEQILLTYAHAISLNMSFIKTYMNFNQKQNPNKTTNPEKSNNLYIYIQIHSNTLKYIYFTQIHKNFYQKRNLNNTRN